MYFCEKKSSDWQLFMFMKHAGYCRLKLITRCSLKCGRKSALMLITFVLFYFVLKVKPQPCQVIWKMKCLVIDGLCLLHKKGKGCRAFGWSIFDMYFDKFFFFLVLFVLLNHAFHLCITGPGRFQGGLYLFIYLFVFVHTHKNSAQA